MNKLIGKTCSIITDKEGIVGVVEAIDKRFMHIKMDGNKQSIMILVNLDQIRTITYVLKDHNLIQEIKKDLEEYDKHQEQRQLIISRKTPIEVPEDDSFLKKVKEKLEKDIVIDIPQPSEEFFPPINLDMFKTNIEAQSDVITNSAKISEALDLALKDIDQEQRKELLQSKSQKPIHGEK